MTPPLPHRRFLIVAALGLALICPAANLGAQDASARLTPGRAVDPTATDLGPLAAPLRRVDPGNAVHSFAARLTVADFRAGWSPFDPATPLATDPATGLTFGQAFEYNAPGVRARTGRPDLVETPRGPALGVPADTVYLLTLPRPEAVTSDDPRPTHPHFRDLRFAPSSQPDTEEAVPTARPTTSIFVADLPAFSVDPLDLIDPDTLTLPDDHD
ncbi:MAG: hypothetical protein AAF710_06670 [Planctomycetota bacterium]